MNERPPGPRADKRHVRDLAVQLRFQALITGSWVLYATLIAGLVLFAR